MYLHLGNSAMVRKRDILGLFDLDNTSQSRRTRDFLSAAEKNGRVVNASGAELPKSFVLCAEQGAGTQTVYLSQLNSTTLARRSEGSAFEEN